MSNCVILIHHTPNLNSYKCQSTAAHLHSTRTVLALHDNLATITTTGTNSITTLSSLTIQSANIFHNTIIPHPISIYWVHPRNLYVIKLIFLPTLHTFTQFSILVLSTISTSTGPSETQQPHAIPLQYNQYHCMSPLPILSNSSYYILLNSYPIIFKSHRLHTTSHKQLKMHWMTTLANTTHFSTLLNHNYPAHICYIHLLPYIHLHYAFSLLLLYHSNSRDLAIKHNLSYLTLPNHHISTLWSNPYIYTINTIVPPPVYYFTLIISVAQTYLNIVDAVVSMHNIYWHHITLTTIRTYRDIHCYHHNNKLVKYKLSSADYSTRSIFYKSIVHHNTHNATNKTPFVLNCFWITSYVEVIYRLL